jgi:hypothetical protein
MPSIQDDDLLLRKHILEKESTAILAEVTFQRSPTLSKLLQFLVNETIAGRGELLKSYTIAVDALGRADDFDPSTDSSARVQMIRLRKLLESYYAKNSPTDRLCLYLQSGSYVVQLAEPSIAYPTLYRLNAATLDAQLGVKSPDALPPVTPPARRSVTDWFLHDKIALVLTAILVTALVASSLFWVYYRGASAARNAYLSPIVEVMPIEQSRSPELNTLAASLRRFYESDLPRFKFARVRLEDESGSRQNQSVAEAPQYKLYSRLSKGTADNVMLSVNIEHVYDNSVIWTRELTLTNDPATNRTQIVPLLGEINGPVGAIGLHQQRLTQDRNDGGYPCIVKYFRFIRTRSNGLEQQLVECFAKPVVEKEIAATVLAIRGMFELERRAAQRDFKAANIRGLALARRGFATDPSDAWANFAMARLSYASGDCRSAIVYTTRTMDANPNHPIFPSVLASLAHICKYQGSEALLDQALLTQNPLYIRSRLLLVQAAIYMGHPEKIAQIKDSELPETRLQRRYYYVTETLIAASQGRIAEANRNWRAFKNVSDPDAHSADAKLQTLIMIPRLRAMCLTYLKDAGVTL